MAEEPKHKALHQTMEQVEGKSVDIPTGLFVKTEGDPIGMETSGNSLPALQGLKSENLTPTPNATGNAHQEAINQSFWSVQRQTLKDSIIWPPLQPQPGVNASTSTSQNCRPIDWNVSSGMNSFVATELNEPRYITQQQYWPTVAPFPSQPPAPPQIQMERGHNLESLNICNPIVPHHDASPTYDYNHASRGPQASHQGPNQGRRQRRREYRASAMRRYHEGQWQLVNLLCRLARTRPYNEQDCLRQIFGGRESTSNNTGQTRMDRQ